MEQFLNEEISLLSPEEIEEQKKWDREFQRRRSELQREKTRLEDRKQRTSSRLESLSARWRNLEQRRIKKYQIKRASTDILEDQPPDSQTNRQKTIG